MRRTPPCLVALVILLTFGCAQRPVLYPNEHYADVGAEASKQDIAECIALADEADLDTNHALEAGKRSERPQARSVVFSRGSSALLNRIRSTSATWTSASRNAVTRPSAGNKRG
jgi:hypothetical protein